MKNQSIVILMLFPCEAEEFRRSRSSKRTSNSGNPLATSRKNKSKPLLKTGFLAPVQICSPGTREIRTLARFSKRKTKPFSMFDFIKRLFPRKGRSRFVDLSGKACSDEEYNRIRQQQQAEAMRILHKISTKGEKSLHPEEKEFLKRFSQSNYNR